MSAFEIPEKARQEIDRAHARVSDPQTSHDASLSVTDLLPRQSAVLYLLRVIGPSTDDELVSAYGRLEPRQEPSGIRSRRSELVKAGLVLDSGLRRRLKTGRRAIVWEAATERVEL